MAKVLERAPTAMEDFSAIGMFRPFLHYYWLLLLSVAIGVAGILAFSYARPLSYASESLLVVDASYVSPMLAADLFEERGKGLVEVTFKPSGLIRLTSTAKSPQHATSNLSSVIDKATVDLMATLPDYSAQIRVAQERYAQFSPLVYQAGTIEEKLVISSSVAGSLGAIYNLEQRKANTANLVKVVMEPTAPSDPQPRYSLNRLVLGAAAGLVLGVLVAYVLFNKAVWLQALKTNDPVRSEP